MTITDQKPAEGSHSDKPTLVNFGVPLGNRGGIIMPHKAYCFRTEFFAAGDTADLAPLTEQVDRVSYDLVERSLECVLRDDCCNVVAWNLQRLYDHNPRHIERIMVSLMDSHGGEDILRQEDFAVRLTSHLVEHRYDDGEPLRHRLKFDITSFSICSTE